MNVCLRCGELLADKYCYACASDTLPEDLVPTRCWDCGRPIQTPPHLREWMGLCEVCTAKALLRKETV